MNDRIESVEWIVIHSSATNASEDIGVKELRYEFMQRGCADIGYLYVVRRNGTVEKGCNAAKAGHHAEGYDFHSLAICMVGGRKGDTQRAEDNYTPEQYDSLWGLLCELKVWHPDADVVGYRDLPGLSPSRTGLSPSFDVGNWLKERTSEAAIRPQDRNEAGV